MAWTHLNFNNAFLKKMKAIFPSHPPASHWCQKVLCECERLLLTSHMDRMLTDVDGCDGSVSAPEEDAHAGTAPGWSRCYVGWNITDKVVFPLTVTHAGDFGRWSTTKSRGSDPNIRGRPARGIGCYELGKTVAHKTQSMLIENNKYHVCLGC